MKDEIKKAFEAGFKYGYKSCSNDLQPLYGISFPMTLKSAWESFKSRPKKEKYYAIYSDRIHEAIGVCTDAGAESALEEDPECRLVKITKKQYYLFDDDTRIKLNSKTGKAEVWLNGKIVGPQ